MTMDVDSTDYSDSDGSASPGGEFDVYVADTEDGIELNSEDEEDRYDTEMSIKWLRDRYPGTCQVLIQFGADGEKLVLPRELLTKHFKYFRAALQTRGEEPAFLEGHANHVFNIEGLSEGSFSFVLRYLSEDYDEGIGIDEEEGSIDKLFFAIISADYFGLDSPKIDFMEFEEIMIGHLRAMLLYDHKQVKPRHLELAENHSAFESKKIWCVLAQAGVRPYLQQYMLDPGYKLRHIEPQCPGTSTWACDGWVKVIRYHRKLRADNERYALKVMEEVSKTLLAGRVEQREKSGSSRTVGWEAVRYRDPLYKGSLFGILSLPYQFTA